MKALVFMLAMMFFLMDCGTNVFQGFEQEEKDQLQLTLTALEEEDPARAVALVLDILPKAASDILINNDPRAESFVTDLAVATANIPERRKTLSVLGTSYAQKGGIKPLTFMIELTKIQEEEDAKKKTALALADLDEEKEAISKFFPLFPSDALNKLPDIERSALVYEVFKDAHIRSDSLFHAITVFAVFITGVKVFDTNGDSVISETEAKGLKATASDGEPTARFLYNQLKKAKDVIGDLKVITGISELDRTESKINGFISKIDGQTVPEEITDIEEILTEQVRKFLVESTARFD